MAMEARNRDLTTWFHMVGSGAIMLPRFQRYEAWSPSEITGLLGSVVADLPIGSAMVLAVDDSPPFITRTIAGEPVPPSGTRTLENLLDGQQRLTALWRSLRDGYPDRKYFLWMKEDGEWGIRSVSRYEKDGQAYPLWADRPQDQYARRLVPIALMRPGLDGSELGHWVDLAEMSRAEERKLGALRSQIGNYNFPLLSLPVETPKGVAIDVFVKLNSNQEELSVFDIIVAQAEAETEQSLHALVEGISRDIPAIESYMPISALVLRMAALREGMDPTESSFHRLNLTNLILNWESTRKGIEDAKRFLEEERVFDRQRLPTVAVIPVIAAIFSDLPSLDAAGRTRILLKKYLWRSFFTNRYEFAAGTAALNDYRYIKAEAQGGTYPSSSIFDDDEYPIASEEMIKAAGWPKRRNTLARGILAVALQAGGLDFADESPISRESIRGREYHHLFPDHLLREDGQLANGEGDKAVNCALITWNTNRNIAAKAPIAYLARRAQDAPEGESDVRRRLATHLIPFDRLNVSDHAELSGEEKAEAIREDYEAFLDARARRIKAAADALANGEDIPRFE